MAELVNELYKLSLLLIFWQEIEGNFTLRNNVFYEVLD